MSVRAAAQTLSFVRDRRPAAAGARRLSPRQPAHPRPDRAGLARLRARPCPRRHGARPGPSRSRCAWRRSSRKRAAIGTAVSGAGATESWSWARARPRPRARALITEARALGGLALTRLLQIVSPALPIGAFAYSQGLEQAVRLGWVTDEASARDWLLGLLEHRFGTLDLPVLRALLEAWRDATTDGGASTRWSAWLLACRPTRETRAEDRQLGAALARTLTALGVPGADAWMAREDVTHAAMFALAAVRFGIPAVGRAGRSRLRLGRSGRRAPPCASVPLGQSAGQRCSPRSATRSPPWSPRARARRRELGAAAPRAGHRQRLARNPLLPAVPIVGDTAPMHKTATASCRRGRPGRLRQDRAVDALCKRLRDDYRHRRRHQRHLHQGGRRVPHPQRRAAAERIVGVETGGCPHTAIREDASMNLDAVDDLSRQFPDLDLVIVESGGDNLAATFSPELADLTIYVIDVSGGDKIPRKGGPGITQSRSARHQQDRPRPARRRRPRRHGPRREEDARRAPVRLHQSGRAKASRTSPPS